MINSKLEELHMSKELNNKVIKHVQNAVYEMGQILHLLNIDNKEYDDVKKK